MRIQTFLHYLQFEKRYSDHTLLAYQTDLNQLFSYLDQVYGDTDPLTLSSQQIRSWVVHLVRQSVSAKSIHRKLSAVKSFYKFLMKKGELSQNPAQHVSAPKAAKRLPSFARSTQMEQLFSILPSGDDFHDMRDRLIFELLYQTGIRRSELIHLSIESIDLQKGRILVKGKGNKERFVPFGDHLAKRFESYFQIREKAFPGLNHREVFLTNKGLPLYPKFVYNLVNKYLSIITTAEQRSPHMLRHTFATHLMDKGADLYAVKELLGHSSLAATQVYTHNSIEKLKRVYDKAHPKAKIEES